jgi:hypothetical protein
MHWLVHVLARLAITATCTDSVAALNARLEPPKHPSFTNSLSERLMLNSSKSVNDAVRRRGVPELGLRIEARTDLHIASEESMQAARSCAADANPLVAAAPVMTWADTSLRSVLWSVLEGFAAYGASLHVIAIPPVTANAREVGPPQPQKPSWRERRESISLVASSTGAGPVIPAGVGMRARDDRDDALSNPGERDERR